MLNEQDKIKELFSDKLGNFQAPVNPELWSSIASQIGATTTMAAAGTSVLAKTIIGIAAAGVIAVGTYFVVNSENESNLSVAENNPIKNEQLPEPTSETESNKEEVELKNIDNSQTFNSTMGVREKVKVGKDNDPLIDANFGALDESNLKVNHNQEIVVEPKSLEPLNSAPKVLTKIPKDAPVEKIEKDKFVQPTKVTEPVLTKVALASISETPDIFTPNGDNVNDELFIKYSGELIDFSLVIMSMNNTTVYETKNPDFRWRGEMMNGDVAPNGNYVYIIVARDANGVPINKYQRLTITR